jgi:short-subunit dehydrogenase
VAHVKRHAAITGASAGIGAAIAHELARRGYRLTLVARRRDLLDQLASKLGAEVFVVAHDLADVDRSTEWIASAEEALGPIDVLVNNAGVQIIGRSPELEWERQEQMLKLDLLTPLKLTRALLPGMVRRGEGTIVDVASVAALAPTPYMAGYNAAKAGLAAASESMRAELKRVGVHVVTVYPGPIDTAMGTAGYAAYEPSPALQSVPLGSPEVLARLVARAIEKKKARVIYPRMYAVTRWFPGPTRWFLDLFTPQPRSAAPRSNG